MSEASAEALQEFLGDPDHDQRLRRAAARRAYVMLQSATEGEDLFAEAVYRAYIRWGRLDDGGDSERRLAWLITIIDNVARERSRSRGRRPNDDDIRMIEGLPGRQDQAAGRQAHHLLDPTGERVADREVLLELLPEAMAALSDRCRAVMQLYLDGVAEEYIAVELGIAASTVRVTLLRARAQLTAPLQPVVSQPGGGASA